MKHEVNYIDKLTGENLKSFKISPETNWDTFKTGLLNSNMQKEFFSDISNYYTTKRIMLTVVGLSILTAGILFYKSNTNNKGKILVPVQKENVTPIISTTIEDFKTIDSENTNNPIIKDSTSTKTNKTEDVIIRVEVPIHKEVFVLKEVVLKDTIN